MRNRILILAGMATLMSCSSLWAQDSKPDTSQSHHPEIIYLAAPDYPDSLRVQGVEGAVVIKVLIDTEGSVDQAVVLQSAHPVLDSLALKAVGECRFRPGSQRGIPVKAWMAIPYTFRLPAEDEQDDR